MLTQTGELRYELFQTYICSVNNKELNLFNGSTGERWRYNTTLNKWQKKNALKLSEIEKVVLSYSVTGLSAKEIAERVCRSEVTVKKTKARIMQAVGANTMTEAAFMLSHYRFM